MRPSESIRRRPPAPWSVDLAEQIPDLHPVLQRVYAQRGVRSAAELDLSLAQLAPPHGMVDLEQAGEALAQALLSEARICIVGDYDADGATATAVLMQALTSLARACGVARVQLKFFIPDRFELGYGLTPAVVERLRPQQPDWLVTVDNGISSIEGAAAARAAGMRVIITDHHSPPERLPVAEAVVNPLRGDDRFASRALAGVGVAFYLAAAVRQALQRRLGGQVTLPSLAPLLDLVALGTVADLVPLDVNNRILVAQGLRRIRSGAARPGLYALLALAGRDPRTATATDLAFGVAPRLNAAGRLANMSTGVECLLADTKASAQQRSQELDRLNRERREVEARMTDEALLAIEAAHTEEMGLGLCVSAPDWHQGVTGIVASRLKERYHRPVVAFAPAGNGTLRGSGRSVPGLHMRDALARVERDVPQLIKRFGGHAMAAGLTIAASQLGAFRAAFARAVDEMLNGELPPAIHESDGPLSREELTLETARALRDGGPWGVGFPEPHFDGLFVVDEVRPLRGGHLRLALRLIADPVADEQSEPARGLARGAGSVNNEPAPVNKEAVYPGIFFGGAEKIAPERLDAPVRLLYTPDINCFRGNTTLQLRIAHLESIPPDRDL
ncbi:single-stranded-DNA-specific exonuclease RecJ [Halorhodospira abdelmalekii]|nr:single-stranded-DNA-specific exonuclease RecJ [Halorhodospira abdelmalekii]